MSNYFITFDNQINKRVDFSNSSINKILDDALYYIDRKGCYRIRLKHWDDIDRFIEVISDLIQERNLRHIVQITVERANVVKFEFSSAEEDNIENEE